MRGLLPQLLSQRIAPSEIGHQEEDTQEGDDQRDEIEAAGKQVVEAMERGGDEQRQHIERLAILGIESGHAYEVAADASPHSMEERQGGQSRDVQHKRGGVVGPDVDRRLILHTLEDAEGYTRHETIEHHRLWQLRLARPTLQDEQRDHLGKLLGQANAEDIAENAQRERCRGETVEEVQFVEPREDDEHAELGEEERGDGLAPADLPRTEEIGEEQSPDGGEVETHGIKDEIAADGQQHDDGQRQAYDGEDEQSLVLHDMVTLHVVLGEDKRMTDISELLHERATVAHSRMDAVHGKQFLYGSLHSGRGITRSVVEQQPALFYVSCNIRLLVRSVFVVVSDDDQHSKIAFYCFAIRPIAKARTDDYLLVLLVLSFFPLKVVASCSTCS